MAVWRLTTHHIDQDRLLKWSFDHSKIALGWSEVGDLRKFENANEISLRAHVAYPDNRNWSVSGRQLWGFCHELKTGDLVILSSRGRRAAVFEVTGEYVFDSNAQDDNYYGHQRSARPVGVDANELWKQAGGTATGQAIYWSLIKCSVDPRAR